MREVIKEGRDVNEAIDLACAELGLERGEVEMEIISLPKRSFFGFKTFPAKVRVFEKAPDKPVLEKKEIVQKAPEKPISRQDEKREPIEMQKKKPAQEVASATVEQKNPSDYKEITQPQVFFPMAEAEGKARAACEYVQSVLLEMGINAQITLSKTENGIILRLAGDGLGVVIGRRGETLDSLQYLASLVANRAEGDYMRVTIDSGNYREKRERTLQQLAKKLSAAALRSGRNTVLEPMNPYERRIIHSTVSQIDGVSSSSIGEEPNRRVVISPANARTSVGTGKPPYHAKGNGARPATGNNVNGARPHYKNTAGQQDGRYRGTDNKAGVRREGYRPPRPNVGGVPASRPTSTDIDRAYASELDVRKPAFVKPEQKEQKAPARENTAPIREKTSGEGDNLPLYGKIEL